ncbi:lipoprotein [Actinokineospora fastidiosa]|uniref:Lipoprotein n=1 Tax=Actinokineospora fastidiosa TaxID=1816 RepID=A0A918GB59_9PSEU|nr:lipoprotein [Actinokineospora fastidiosa]
MRLPVAAVATAVLLAGCSSGQPQDELMVTTDPVAATAARSPAPTAEPAGRVLPAEAASAVAVTGSTLAVATDAGVDLYDLAALDKAPRSVALPGPVETLTVDGADLLAAVPTKNQVVRVDTASAATSEVGVQGAPAAATPFADGTIVAVRESKGVAVLTDGTVTKNLSGGLLSADRVFATGDHAVVLDHLRNAVFRLDMAKGSVEEGLRAGEGATNGVVDRFGRVLVVDTRGNSLLAFGLDPLLLRQRYPVPGAPYGIAYDAERDLAWVTLTATNEVVGFDVAGGEPEERFRFPTVGQPNSVAVDPADGRVVVASANGGGVQVIAP